MATDLSTDRGADRAADPAAGPAADATTGPEQDQAAGPGAAPGRTARAVERTRLAAASAVLAVLALTQAPGLVAPDTKLDLTVDPVGFLARSLHLWEPLGASGQLQNQAYGYWLPMGPFFALGQVAHLPGWLVQRLWWALLLLVAFHGAYRLAGRLGLGVPATRLVAAFAFALSPRILSELGAVSVEAWPSAMAPWVLLPLVAVPAGRERRAAARSGLALALAGGVNAVAAGAALVLPAWWLVTRARSRPALRLGGWWCLAVVLATTWWVVPLLLLGRYSPPFVDWIESAAVTTSIASPAAALRGTTHWLPWLGGSQPLWPTGWALVTRPPLVLLTWVVAGLGLLGVVRRRTPHRTFLAGAVLGGVVLLTAGHAGPLAPPWAADVRSLLDGAAAALRNTHKFDVVVRLPLALGLAHVLATVRLPAVQGATWTRHGLRLLAAFAVAGICAPALAGSLPARGSSAGVPDYWERTAAWLGDHPDGGRALVVPGAPFASSLWGDLRDEPLQPLATTPWAVRDTVPLSSAGNIRLLTRVEEVLASGRGAPALAQVLRRAGFSRLVVRADLDGVPAAVPRPAVVRAALTASPGFAPVVRFGPVVGDLGSSTAFVDDALQPPVPAVEIWRIDPPAGAGAGATLSDASSAVRFTGGTEALLDLGDAGLLGERPAVLDGDPLAGDLAAAPLLLTDTGQRREADFARVRGAWSPVLTETAPWRRERRVHDWSPFEPANGRPVAVYEGVEDVTTTSLGTGSPWALLDADPGTTWASAFGQVLGEGVTVTFPGPVTLPSVLVDRVARGADVAAFDVTTDTGTVRTPVDPTSVRRGPDTLALPPGATTRLTVTVAEVRDDAATAVVLAGLTLPGLVTGRYVDVPAATDGATPVAVSLREPRDGTDGCVLPGGRPLCSPALAVAGEAGRLDRSVDLGDAATWTVSGTARPRASGRWAALLRPVDGLGIRAATSSRRSDEPAEGPGAAVDADLGTGWVAAPDDPRPTLRLAWGEQRPLAAMRFLYDPALAASRALTVTVKGDNGVRVGVVGEDGWFIFEPLVTARLWIHVDSVRPARTLRPGSATVLPFGVSELRLPAVEDLVRPLDRSRATSLPCGFGPTVVLAGAAVPTRLVGTVGQVLERAPMQIEPCAQGQGGTLLAGRTRVAVQDEGLVEPVSLRLTRVSLPAAGAVTPVPLDLREQAVRTADVTAADRARVLSVPENFNAGWRAELDGSVLTPVRLDGWMQGWSVPAGAGGTLRLEYLPDRTYRRGLAVGAVLLAVLAVAAAGRRRRGVPAAVLRTGRARRSLLLAVPLALVATVGWAGLAAALVAVPLAARRRWRSVAVVAGAGLAAAVTSWQPAPFDRGTAGLLAGAGALLALAAVAGAALDRTPPD